MKQIKLMACGLCLITAMASCKKEKTDEPAPVNQGELITTVQLLLEDTLSGSIVDTVSFRDPDGPGGQPPVIDSLVLSANAVYRVSVVLLDESKSPVDSISGEVKNESDLHLMVHRALPGSGFLTFQTEDTDNNGLPLGLQAIINTGSAATGTYTVELRHFDTAALKLSGTTYETDVQVSFGTRLN
ncbi:MAG: hypothetical protein JNL88_03775 [Bacteroidia bacterium]|nr:hypothetical protein [Bacteroidia bacterium]